MGPIAASPTATLLQEHDSSGELRGVALHIEANGALRVRESTSGDLTETVFGCRSRHHEIALPQEGVRAFLEAHSSESATVVLRRFFASGVAYLSDLMDELDSLGIAYAYVSYLPSGDAFFRPPHQDVEQGRDLALT